MVNQDLGTGSFNGRRTIAVDSDFSKYQPRGAYHWRDIGRNWLRHNAFTAERYRRVVASCPRKPLRVLDYGCGDGAFLWTVSRSFPEAVLHAYDPNAKARELATESLAKHNVRATLYSDPSEIPSDHFDAVFCMEVIEHALDPHAIMADLHRLLTADGYAVVTSPVRLTEAPLDENHQREWFPSEFYHLLDSGPMDVVSHELVIPVAATEVYLWKSPYLAHFPVFRVVCNIASIHFNINALTWLGLRARFFALQIAVLRKVDHRHVDRCSRIR